MQDNLTLLDRALAFLLLPATVWGAGGALFHSSRKGRTPLQVLFEGIGGAFTTHMLSPFVVKYVPPDMHPIIYFYLGWGGLEFVGRIYEAGASALENRIRNTINPPDGRE